MPLVHFCLMLERNWKSSAAFHTFEKAFLQTKSSTYLFLTSDQKFHHQFHKHIFLSSPILRTFFHIFFSKYSIFLVKFLFLSLRVIPKLFRFIIFSLNQSTYLFVCLFVFVYLMCLSRYLVPV